MTPTAPFNKYSFPEIVAILNDGSKSYDLGKDGAGQESGRCSVSVMLFGLVPLFGTPRSSYDIHSMIASHSSITDARK